MNNFKKACPEGNHMLSEDIFDTSALGQVGCEITSDMGRLSNKGIEKRMKEAREELARKWGEA